MTYDSIKERFEDKYIPEPNSGCWLWIASVDRQGYGWFGVGGKNKKSHRVAYELYVGPIPDNPNAHHGTCVLHRCDTPECVNPSHLFLGSIEDNVADRVKKGRTARVLGEERWSAKLTEQQAREIFYAEGTTAEIGKRYGVTRHNVGLIKNKKRWQHIHD